MNQHWFLGGLSRALNFLSGENRVSSTNFLSRWTEVNKVYEMFKNDEQERE